MTEVATPGATRSCKYFPEMIQGSDEWFAARCGLLTASEMHLIVTPTLKIASNDKQRSHLYELLAQRVTGYVEPAYISSDMLRGQEDEIEARALYAKNHAPVREVGFITNSKWGFTLGYSPDGMVGLDGAIECKSRRQKFQAQTIIDMAVPLEYMIQLQAGILVAELGWIDFVSYCGGMPMFVQRVYRDPVYEQAILSAAKDFESRITEFRSIYDSNKSQFLPTERRIELEMFI